MIYHDDVIKWKHFLCYWPFVRGIHQSPVNSTPVTQSFDGSFDLCFKKGFSKQLWGWWFETPPHSWRHHNVKELRSLLPILSRDSKWIWAGSKQCFMMHCPVRTLIARFMGPTWGPSGPDKTQVGPKSFAIWEWVSCECKCNHEGVISYSLHLELGTTYFEVLLAKRNKAVWSTKCIFLTINSHTYLKKSDLTIIYIVTTMCIYALVI